MAHSCPDCDQLCHCGGDIDDCELDLRPSEGCSHCCWEEEEDGDEEEAWREEEEREEEAYLERLRTQQLEEDPPA